MKKTAYYIASYSLKGETFEYTHTDGEIYTLKDSMDCSKRPAIGSKYLEQNATQLVYSEQILPRYYLKRLKELNPTLHEHYENERLTKLKTRGDHELLAKYTISQQKIQHDSEYRSTPANTELHEHTVSQYKFNRDEFHRINKEKDK